MMDNFINFLQDDTKIYNLWLWFVGGIIMLLILRALFKRTKIKPKVFNSIILYLPIIFFILLIINVIITKNHCRLWCVLFVAATIILQKYVPKFVKWYDRKVDKLIEKDHN